MKVRQKRTVWKIQTNYGRYIRIKTENGTISWKKEILSDEDHSRKIVGIRYSIQQSLENQFQNNE